MLAQGRQFREQRGCHTINKDHMFLVAFTALAFWGLQASAAPTEMTKLVVRLMGPGIRPNSQTALPKTIYVADPHFARIEDPPDARQGLQKLTIIAEPDAYSVNLIDKKGTHARDQGGPNDLHLPIVLPFDPKHHFGVLDKVEFGNEVEFFKQAGAKKEAGPIINGQPSDRYTLKLKNVTAQLVVKPDGQIPEKLSWESTAGKFVYEYITVEELPFDRSLFSRPAGIHFQEIKPDPSSDQS
ncbi:MAG: hypothetical protein JWP08_4161 [Bryobacterales bacterium]|nr:hypothetical protein [Bryobacterales bacterium]